MPAQGATVVEHLATLMADLLGVPAAEITDDASMETIRTWDSLKHMEFIAAIEEEFDIEPLTTDEIVAMTSIAAMKEILPAKGLAL